MMICLLWLVFSYTLCCLWPLNKYVFDFAHIIGYVCHAVPPQQQQQQQQREWQPEQTVNSLLIFEYPFAARMNTHERTFESTVAANKSESKNFSYFTSLENSTSWRKLACISVSYIPCKSSWRQTIDVQHYSCFIHSCCLAHIMEYNLFIKCSDDAQRFLSFSLPLSTPRLMYPLQVYRKVICHP